MRNVWDLNPGLNNFMLAIPTEGASGILRAPPAQPPSISTKSISTKSIVLNTRPDLRKEFIGYPRLIASIK